MAINSVLKGELIIVSSVLPCREYWKGPSLNTGGGEGSWYMKSKIPTLGFAIRWS